MSFNFEERIRIWNWPELEAQLHEGGYARTPPILSSEECNNLIGLYHNDQLFRSRVEMARHNFGQGEYKYLAYPLPTLVEELRQAFYPRLVPVANDWLEKFGRGETTSPYPSSLVQFLEKCHAAGQTRPTPLILRYEKGGYNCLHQDLYGELAFPLQVVFGLSQREIDYGGGELLLVEQRPRAQSVGQVITLEQGEALIFTNRYRPVPSSRGYYRANVRHGVSRLHRGVRYSLGLIFHDAQ